MVSPTSPLPTPPCMGPGARTMTGSVTATLSMPVTFDIPFGSGFGRPPDTLTDKTVATRTSLLIRHPFPVADLRVVLTVLAGVTTGGEARIGHLLTEHRGPAGQPVDPVDDLHHQVEAVQVVEHHHVERRRRGAALLEAADVHVMVVGATVGEPVDQPRITVVSENDRLVAAAQSVGYLVHETIWVILGR